MLLENPLNDFKIASHLYLQKGVRKPDLATFLFKAGTFA